MALFGSRHAAGEMLARTLAGRHYADPVVLAIARGGVPVAAPVAAALHAPLDLLLVRKIGVPWQPELAAAAVIDGATPEIALDEPVMRSAGLDRAYVETQAKEELAEIERRRRTYLADRPPVLVHGRTAIVIDDGVATGTTMRAALRAVRKRGPARLVLAVPCAARESLAELRAEVDEVVCLQQPEPFYAVGLNYEEFNQVSDAEVIRLMKAAADVAT
jgi:putative phosphoribosyl transferase